MNGQLNERPPAELIREITAKQMSGRLRLQQEPATVVVYFDQGRLLYAASNIRALRLREYLLKANLVSESDLSPFADRPDIALTKTLCDQGFLTPTAAQQVTEKQVADVLRLALLWLDGTWEFDHRSKLVDAVALDLNLHALFLETARRLPLKYAASRFRNPAEFISPVASPPKAGDLMPTEVFLLSRLDRPTTVSDLVALSGQRETDSLHIAYSLALAGLVDRQYWKAAFRSEEKKATQEEKPPAMGPPPVVEQAPVDDVTTLLARLTKAQTHYEVLGLANNASAAEIKLAYYDLARRFHPDRFRRESDATLHSQIESSFARITQAYDTLQETGSRAAYDSKLDAQLRAHGPAKSAPKAASTKSDEPIETKRTGEASTTDGHHAETDFKEGLAALQRGQTTVAIGLFASAARAMPREPRYRAYYGHALAGLESTRRRAEIELQTALKLEPNNVDYRVMLAELYRDLGFTVRARGEAERAVAAAPNHTKARELLRSIR